MEQEIWKTIEDFPNYEVSSLGNVRNKTTGLIRKQSIGEGRYYHVDLYKGDGKSNGYARSTHVLVAETFLGKHPGLVVNHKDGNKKNNQLYNLEWVTQGDNQRHGYAMGLRKPPGEKPVRIIETGETFKSITDCAKAIGGDVQNISACLNGKRHRCNNLHFEYVDTKIEPKIATTGKPFLYDYQLEAVMRLQNGNILCGGVGSGKSRSGLFYYFKENGGWIDENEYIPMKDPEDLYIITTAKKRDSCEWLGELSPFLMSPNPEVNYYKNKIVIDSWNNIGKYKDVTGAFFLLDEQRIVGNGSWVKTFLKIAKTNRWILLTATPGDNYSDYLPVFLANGFFKNRTEFNREHVVYSRYTKFPMIERYVNTYRLDRLRDRVLVKMNYQHEINTHHEDVYCKYDIFTYKDVMRRRWDIYKDEPIQQASTLCYILRKIVNSDDSRGEEVLRIVKERHKVIIFYSFDYELEILRNLQYGDHVKVAELNGHKHQPVPEGTDWVYLVNYAAGAEAWACIKTDSMIFYSQNYSYKVMIQAAGRIDRLNTPYRDLYYYHLKSRSPIDLAISKALATKKKFNETKFVKW